MIEIEPVPGHVVIDPDSGKPITSRTDVPDNQWWRSRVKEGTVSVPIHDAVPSLEVHGDESDDENISSSEEITAVDAKKPNRKQGKRRR